MADAHVDGGRLSAFLDDELEDDAAIEVARHVAACPPCWDELEDLRAARDALRRLPHLQAPVLTSEVRARSDVLRTLSRRLRWVTAAVAVVAALAGVAYVAGEDGDVVPPVELFLVDHVARTGGGPVPPPVGTPPR